MNLLSKLILSVLLCILLTDICRGKQSSSTPARLPDEVIRQLELAEQGSPTAQEYMGYLYQTGTEIPKDEGKAVKWCRKAADQGHAIAQYDLGMMYLNGAGVPKDEIEAVKWFRKAADQGHATAQFNLGMLYLNGVGVPKDELEAAKWFRKAADQGHDDAQKALIQMQTAREEAKRVQNEAKRVQKEAERVQKEAERVQKEAERVQTIYTNALHGNADAQLQLGLMCQSRWDSVKYQVDAAKWYRKAADQGNATAQYNLGVMYRTGAGVPKDEAEAVKWCRKAADQGHAIAQYDLGMMYLNGAGVPKDEIEAVKWCRKAGDQGHVDAQKALIQMQTASEEALRVQNEALRVQTIYTNALRGNADAQLQLGLMCQNRWGSVKYQVDAAKWYRKAADQGNATAQYNLGVMYRTGAGVPKDELEAAKWLSKAADQGNAEAQVNIGSLYLHGQGVPKDESEAVRWYRRAADQGNSDAQRALLQIQTVHDESERVQKEVERVQTIYTNALQGNADAQFTLGSMYQQGEGITKDPTEGMKWYRKAAEQGHVGALNNIGVACERGVCAVQDNVEACSYYLTASSFGDDENSRKNAKIWRNQLSAEEYAEAQRRAHLRVEAIRKRATSANTSKGGSSTTQDGEPQLIGYGTGFIICQDGYLLTCNHVVQDSKSIKVQVGDTKYPATIARRDVANDLALLKIKGSVFATVPLQTDVPSKGSKVFTVGYPNPELQGMEPKYTDGTISSLSGIQDDIRTLQISVPVQSGNSGGALIDEDGNVIGIVVAKLNAVAAFGYTGDLPQNVNYAIKIMYAMPLIQSVEGLKQRIPLLGKSLKPTNATSTAEKATCMVIVYK